MGILKASVFMKLITCTILFVLVLRDFIVEEFDIYSFDLLIE